MYADYLLCNLLFLPVRFYFVFFSCCLVFSVFIQFSTCLFLFVSVDPGNRLSKATPAAQSISESEGMEEEGRKERVEEERRKGCSWEEGGEKRKRCHVMQVRRRVGRKGGSGRGGGRH